MVAGTIRGAAVIGACTIATDQASKAAVQLLPATGILHPLVNPEFTLGVASASRPVTLVLMGLGIAAAAVTGLRASARGVVPAAAVGLLVAGAASNFLDRVFLDAVRDFLVIGTVVVNLADLAVLAGLIGYAWSLLNRRHRAPSTLSSPQRRKRPATKEMTPRLGSHRGTVREDPNGCEDCAEVPCPLPSSATVSRRS
jgi:lipoprotein signal peptidase